MLAAPLVGFLREMLCERLDHGTDLERAGATRSLAETDPHARVEMIHPVSDRLHPTVMPHQFG
jgi:hypothetical protein